MLQQFKREFEDKVLKNFVVLFVLLCLAVLPILTLAYFAAGDGSPANKMDVLGGMFLLFFALVILLFTFLYIIMPIVILSSAGGPERKSNPRFRSSSIRDWNWLNGGILLVLSSLILYTNSDFNLIVPGLIILITASAIPFLTKDLIKYHYLVLIYQVIIYLIINPYGGYEELYVYYYMPILILVLYILYRMTKMKSDKLIA